MNSTYNSALLYDSVLTRIYGAGEQILSDDECLSSIKSLLDAASATVIITKGDTHQIVEAKGVGVSQATIESPPSAYIQKLWRLDPGTRMCKPVVMFRADEYFSKADLREFFNQCLRPFNLAPFISITTQINTSTNLCLRVARLENQGEFTNLDLGLAQALAKHLRTAISQAEPSLDSQTASKKLLGTAEVMRSIKLGIIILDENYKIVFCNDRAQRYLELAPISVLVDQLQLQDLMSEREGSEETGLAASNFSPSSIKCFSVSAKKNQTKIRVLSQQFSNLSSFNSGTQKLTVMYVSSDQISNIDPFVLGPTYGLSAAESKVAALLAQGYSVDQIAQNIYKSRNTIRAHCRSIYEKMDVSSQAQLMAIILSSFNGLIDLQSAIND